LVLLNWGWISLTGTDWASLFRPDTPLTEIFVRGTITYLALFALLRIVLKRQSGDVGLSDLLVVVLIADAAQNGMANDYSSVTDGIFLVATIVFWSYALDWLGYRFPRFQTFVRPPPLQLIRDGNIIRRNLRKELLTEEELRSMVRESGYTEFGEIKEAFMEGDGQVSIVPFKKES
jgi:uncharacterized membrane protein YcaP (DUF421 family)